VDDEETISDLVADALSSRFALDPGFARVEGDGSRLKASQALAARS
jgi:hypothetical protein